MATIDSMRPEAAKLRWGEIDEDNVNGDNLNFLLPPRVIDGPPDENGIKKTIEYQFDDNGNKLGKARVSKRRGSVTTGPSLAMRCKRPAMGSRLTMVSTEEITLLERPRAISDELARWSSTWCCSLVMSYLRQERRSLDLQMHLQ